MEQSRKTFRAFFLPCWLRTDWGRRQPGGAWAALRLLAQCAVAASRLLHQARLRGPFGPRGSSPSSALLRRLHPVISVLPITPERGSSVVIFSIKQGSEVFKRRKCPLWDQNDNRNCSELYFPSHQLVPAFPCLSFSHISSYPCHSIVVVGGRILAPFSLISTPTLFSLSIVWMRPESLSVPTFSHSHPARPRNPVKWGWPWHGVTLKKDMTWPDKEHEEATWVFTEVEWKTRFLFPWHTWEYFLNIHSVHVCFPNLTSSCTTISPPEICFSRLGLLPCLMWMNLIFLSHFQGCSFRCLPPGPQESRPDSWLSTKRLIPIKQQRREVWTGQHQWHWPCCSR